MMKSNGKTQVKNDEFSRIFDEYRTKIEEITRRTENNMQKEPPQVRNADSGNGDSPVVAISNEKPEPGDGLVEVEWQSEKAAEEIINEANKKAWEQFFQWKKPFLTAFSDKDPVTRGGDLFWQENVPGAQGQNHQTIKDAGHFLQEDKGPELANHIIEFIRNNP